MATLLNTNIRGEQVANATISGVHIVDYCLAPIKIDVYNSPGDGDVLTYKDSTSQFEWNSIGTMVVNEIPTGSINGANTTFVLNDTPVGNTLEVNLNGILQQPGVGNDYTSSGVNLAFTTAPETGDIILCSYLVSAGLGGGVYTDHGNLDGLGDDDHSQYILVNGNRAFTGAVAGVTPTIAAHLATMGYVDTEIGSHTHDAGDVISSTFADARIAQTNVTQHEGAINHNALLNTHNLTTSIDHDTILHHHNLTTDIDHNALTNYAVGQHRTINDAGSANTDLWSAEKIATEIASASGTTDHGALDGLSDDDHTQYLLTDGTRTVTGDFTVSGSINLLSSSYKIVGDNAISFPVANTNIAIGYNTGSALTTGAAFNTLIGSPAGAKLTTGARNQIIGYSTGYWLTTGSDNVLIGNAAGQCSNGYGSYNYAVCLGASAGSAGVGNGSICVGYQAGVGVSGKTHVNSVCIGYQAGYSLANDSGGAPSGNICIGYRSGDHIKGVGATTPNYNVSIGSEAAYSTINGSNNVVIGRRAGYGIPGYSYANNTIIGHEAGYTVSGTGNVFVGYQAGYNEIGYNKLYISNSDTVTPLIYGEFDNTLIRINGNLDVSGTVKIGSAGTLEAEQDSPTGSGVLGYNGHFYATKVYNAVYNDIADFQEVQDEIEYGKCYYDTPDGAKLCTERCQMAVIGIASDTYGFGVGNHTDESYAPFAIAGWVLAHVDKEYPTGTPLTNNEEGILTEILPAEKREFPERIVATYKKKEADEFWGPNGEVKVNGRSWVKVK